MYLKTIKLYNFRKFGTKEGGSSGLTLHLNPSFNILVGENDAGKTAIVDAIRYLLGSVSDEYEKIKPEDFFSYEKDKYSEEFCIEGFFSGLSEKEAGLFLEWLSFDEVGEYSLRVALKVEKRKNDNGNEYIDRKLVAGEESFEHRLDSAAREVLKTTYLKPLRDANAELKPGVKSRLVNILKAHPTFKEDNNGDHKLVSVMKKANEEIVNYFETEYVSGHSILQDVESLLEDFYDNADLSKSKAKFSVTKTDLNSILRKLSLDTEDINLGLGNQNLLFIATELLLLNNYLTGSEVIGPNITLIEEVEAHLHTQAQIRLIKFLENELEDIENASQFILTSHSPNLVASINPSSIILLYDNCAYPLKEGYTMLNELDYKFLERFLDSTKSNLFFAKGVILVEGDSEMLLLPALAELLDYPLFKYGISLVNVRGTSFERYVKLFSRSKLWREEYKLPTLKLPISIITDVDVKPIVYFNEESEDKFRYVLNEGEVDEILQHIDKSKDKLNLSYIGKEYSTLRKLAKDFKFTVTEDNESELNRIIKKNINEDYIKRENLLKQASINSRYSTNYDCNLKVNITPEWTLEYCLSLSCLAEYLFKSIYQLQNNVVDFENEQNEDFTSMLERIRDPKKDIEKVAYNIFKPLNDKTISKAETAQTLATMFKSLGLQEREKLKNLILEDKNLRYLVNAIEHVINKF